jgi:hypothetical protein
MIYQYIWLVIIWALSIYLYRVYAKKLPKIIKKHIYLLQVVMLLSVISFMGLPVKFESTTFSGKRSFQTEHVIVDKVDADAEPDAENLEKQYEILKQNTKDIQNEID